MSWKVPGKILDDHMTSPRACVLQTASGVLCVEALWPENALGGLSQILVSPECPPNGLPNWPCSTDNRFIQCVRAVLAILCLFAMLSLAAYFLILQPVGSGGRRCVKTIKMAVDDDMAITLEMLMDVVPIMQPIQAVFTVQVSVEAWLIWCRWIYLLFHWECLSTVSISYHDLSTIFQRPTATVWVSWFLHRSYSVSSWAPLSHSPSLPE